MIAFEAVSVRYPGAIRDAVTDVSFTAPRGTLTAIVGPNGSGKSTLVRALLRRVRARSGRIRIGGDDVSTLDQRSLARAAAVVPQREDPLFPLPVREFVALGRFPHTGVWRAPSAEDVGAVEAALDRCDVVPLADRHTDQLSGGEWQRVRLARAVAQGAPAIVLDEPTAFLDIAHEMATFELLASLAEAGLTVTIVSHQLNLVARFATHIVLLSAGQVVADGSAETVMRGDVLERVYEWPLVVVRDAATGSPTLVPLRASRGR